MRIRIHNFVLIIFMELLSISLFSCFKVINEEKLKIIQGSSQSIIDEIPMIYNEKIILYIQDRAIPFTDLQIALQADFNKACKDFGYRVSDAFQCNFAVSLSGKVVVRNVKSQRGYVIVEIEEGNQAHIAIGPVIQGTGVRDIYEKINYQNVGDQILFGKIAEAINKEVIQNIARANWAEGNSVSLLGVVSLWEAKDKMTVVPVKLRENISQ